MPAARWATYCAAARALPWFRDGLPAWSSSAWVRAWHGNGAEPNSYHGDTETRRTQRKSKGWSTYSVSSFLRVGFAPKLSLGHKSSFLALTLALTQHARTSPFLRALRALRASVSLWWVLGSGAIPSDPGDQ